MINGVHAIVFSPQADQVRPFFRDVLGLGSVDAGRGWHIFALPPAELAVHPADLRAPAPVSAAALTRAPAAGRPGTG